MKTTRLSIFPSLTIFLTSLTLLFATAAQAQVPSYVSTNGLVGYWPFNGNANDESGNGNNGTVNGAILTTDRFGNTNRAFAFNVNQIQNILISSSMSLESCLNMSANLWVRFNSNSVNNYNRYMNKGNGSSGYQYVFANSWTGIYMYYNNSFFQSTELPPLNEWHMLTMTYNYELNGLDNYCKFYIDGILLQTFPSTLSIVPNNGQLSFGSEPGSPNCTPDGDLDDIGIWNRALTADEVLALYNGCNVAPLAVSGNVTPTQFTQETYTYPNTAGSTYTWTVTNGVIVSGQGTNSIDVMWANTGIGSVSVVETNATTCTGDVVTYDVVVIPTNVEELPNHLILYPNPATTELNLQTTSDLIGTDVFVFDALGKQILKQQILSTNTIINTSSFALGNYVVKVGGGVKKFNVEK